MRLRSLSAAAERVPSDLNTPHAAHGTLPVPVRRMAEREVWEIEFRDELGNILSISSVYENPNLIVYENSNLMSINVQLPSAE